MKQRIWREWVFWAGMIFVSFDTWGCAQAGASSLPVSGDHHDDDRDRRAQRGDRKRWYESDCMGTVDGEAKKQFHARSIAFHSSGMRDSSFPSHGKVVEGTFEIRDGEHQGEYHSYSCSMAGRGQARTVSIGPALRDPRIIVDHW